MLHNFKQFLIENLIENETVLIENKINFYTFIYYIFYIKLIDINNYYQLQKHKKI